MAFTSPQAIGIPNFDSLGDELRNLNKAKVRDIDPPRTFVLTGGADVVFDARPGNALGDKKPVSKLVLHNLGTHAMYYALNMNAGTGVGLFHDILAGGSAAVDGLGSLVDLGADQPDFVTVKGTAGEWVAVVITYPEDQPQVG